jgi:8-oxo-dGTP pyrophosphatase MutT (NUDIX family)
MSIEGNNPGFAGIAGPTEPAMQCAALCFRVRRGKTQVLLVTSRDTGRWLLPKGWPIAGLNPTQTAAREAWEEAGVKGAATEECLGHYSYLKTFADRAGQPCIVAVYPLRVALTADRFRESQQRRRKWFALEKAATLVQEPELQRLITDFARHPLVAAPAKTEPAKTDLAKSGAAKA